MAVEVIRKTQLNPAFGLSKRELTGTISSILDTLGLSENSVTIMLVDDAEIAQINSDYLHCEGPTNILSFPSEDEDDDSLGDLALSVDTLAREVALYGQDPNEHLVRLLAHGTLHLAGYDHGVEMDSLTDMCVESLTQ